MKLSIDFAFCITLSLIHFECSHGTAKTKLIVLLWTRRRQDDHKMKIICFTDGDDHGDDRWGTKLRVSETTTVIVEREECCILYP